MKKGMKIFLLTMFTSLAVGCATNSDIKNLQTQIDTLKPSVAQVSADAAAAALIVANDAKATAGRAAKIEQESNSKLDNTTCGSMRK